MLDKNQTPSIPKNPLPFDRKPFHQRYQEQLVNALTPFAWSSACDFCTVVRRARQRTISGSLTMDASTWYQVLSLIPRFERRRSRGRVCYAHAHAPTRTTSCESGLGIVLHSPRREDSNIANRRGARYPWWILHATFNQSDYRQKLATSFNVHPCCNNFLNMRFK